MSLLKLHGSVNWRQDLRAASAVQVSADQDDFYALDCPDDKMVIASPGPTKLQTANGVLNPLWGAAKAAIKNADAIVFIGYRFPPTDSAARRQLIEAIGDNERQHLAIHAVLGPHTRSVNSERLKSILEIAVARRHRVDTSRGPAPGFLGYSLKAWPLFAEDFLDVCNREQVAPAA